LSLIGEFTLSGANFKFDFNCLHAKGLTIPWEKWQDDVTLLATCLTEKIPQDWLDAYEAERVKRNALLPTGIEHRKSKEHGLKTLAPYFLGVEPFWENPADHDNEEYVLKDCEYAYRLCDLLTEKAKNEGSYEFYYQKMMPWAKLLTKMERRGIRIDLAGLEAADAEARNKAAEALRTLDEMWAPVQVAFKELQANMIDEQYADMLERAVMKLAPEKRAERIDRLVAKYQDLAEKNKAKNIAPINLNSHDQMRWVLRDYFGLDIEDFDGEESTGKAVLQRLAGQGREDIRAFLDYRKQRKLTTAFFPSYRAMQFDGVIRATFHQTTARTGRLSSSDPNLQQVPGHLHKIFIPYAPGRKLIVKDESAIEPRLIAFYTEDKVLYDILDKGLDFHGYNTKIFFNLDEDVNLIKKKYPLEREVGKEVGLAIMYGAGKYRLQESAQKRGFVWTSNECQYKVDKFREHYSEVKKFHDDLDDQLWSNAVTNLFGRQFRIKNRSDIYMKGFNTLIQGSASDLVLHSALRAQTEYERLGLDAHVTLLVHDEIVVDSDDPVTQQADAILEHCMTDYRLTTRHGDIKLKVEGKIANYWEK
jgi:DNA polymerase I-like protein with 3'-5' exonuclease and polymerase domains